MTIEAHGGLLDTEKIEDMEVAIEQMQAQVKNLMSKSYPVSNERLEKVWASVRETMDVFTQRLADEQEQRRLQNEKIAGLTAMNQTLQNAVTVMQAAHQDQRENIRELQAWMSTTDDKVAKYDAQHQLDGG